MHRGTVIAYSALGQGSEFVVRLPMVVPPAPQPPSPPKETAEPTGPSLLGNQAHVTYGGTKALEVATAFRPDLMLVDLVMPDMDGCDLVMPFARFLPSLIRKSWPSPARKMSNIKPWQ